MNTTNETTDPVELSKEVLKKVFNLLKKSDGYKGKMKLFGTEYIEYYVELQWEWCDNGCYLDISGYNVLKASKKLSEVCVEVEPILSNVIDSESDKEFEKWISKMNAEGQFLEKTHGVNMYNLSPFFYNDGKTLNAFINNYKKDFKKQADAKTLKKTEITINLTPAYDAVLVKGHDTVRVGCQSIPINKVRAVVVAWEELNA